MQLKLSPKQLSFFRNSSAQLNFAEGSVRSGKTWGSLFRWIDYIISGPQGADLVMIGKTIGTVERNVIKPMQDLIGNDMRYIRGSNPKIHLWGRAIHILGANDERSYQKIQGPTFAGIYIDELTTMPESLFNMALSRISIEGAKLFATMNPDGPGHWVKKNWLDRINQLDLKRWSFRLEDNAEFLPPLYVENLKKQYTGLWFRRYINGEWCLAEGVVYQFFDEAIHTIERPPPAQGHFVAVDYGTGNPTCFLLFGYNRSTRPEVWAEREYYFDPKVKLQQQTDAEFRRDMIAWLDGTEVDEIIVDPSAASLKLEFSRAGLPVVDADNSVLDGIRTVSTMTVSGRYAICRCCEQTIADKSNYVWNEKHAVKTGEDKPIKQNDHTQDAERYGLQTRYGQAYVDYGLLAKD